MLKQALNEMTITLEIEGKSPLLVKDGRWGRLRPERDTDLPQFVFISRCPEDDLLTAMQGRHWRGSAGFPFYIPGSSLRGAWRSHLEKGLRSLDEDPKVCDPLIGDKNKPPDPYQSCSGRLQNEDEKAEHPYRDSCPVCKLFGSTAQASRLAFSDAERKSGRAVLADNIAISRHTGAVAHGPFRSLVLEEAVFTTRLRLRNFELWQAGLLARLFDDLRQGRAPLGSGKNKGWGQVTATVKQVELSYTGWKDPLGEDGKLRGVGELMSEGALKQYGYWKVEEKDLPTVGGERDGTQSSGWRHVRVYAGDLAGSMLSSCKASFNGDVWRAFRTIKTIEEQRKTEATHA